MTIYIAYSFDMEDYVMRVAGVYDDEDEAIKRLKALHSGVIQRVQLNKPVLFTWEEKAEEVWRVGE